MVRVRARGCPSRGLALCFRRPFREREQCQAGGPENVLGGEVLKQGLFPQGLGQLVRHGTADQQGKVVLSGREVLRLRLILPVCA